MKHFPMNVPAIRHGPALMAPSRASAFLSRASALHRCGGTPIPLSPAQCDLSFGIPRGAAGTDGAPGAPGAPGTDGQQGPQGPTGASGEVSNATLASAIAGTSASTNAVATLDSPFINDPLSMADGELLRAKINELILAQRR